MSRVLFDFVGLMWFYSALVLLPTPWLVARESRTLVASGAVWLDAEKLASSANVTRGNAANATFAFT